MVLIGICGRKTSGKTTITDYVVDNYEFIERSLAGPLKNALRELLLIDNENLYGSEEKKNEKLEDWFDYTAREFMQHVGTELLREKLAELFPKIGTQIFTHNFELWYKKNKDNHVIVSDVRFEDDANIIKKLGGYIIKINRPNLTNIDSHSSEVSVDRVKHDYIIENNGTLEDLYERVDQIMDNFI
jgi:dephospho-CoA kinase